VSEVANLYISKSDKGLINKVLTRYIDELQDDMHDDPVADHHEEITHARAVLDRMNRISVLS
jgi:hypothetical protein